MATTNCWYGCISVSSAPAWVGRACDFEVWTAGAELDAGRGFLPVVDWPTAAPNFVPHSKQKS